MGYKTVGDLGTDVLKVVEFHVKVNSYYDCTISLDLLLRKHKQIFIINLICVGFYMLSCSQPAIPTFYGIGLIEHYDIPPRTSVILYNHSNSLQNVTDMFHRQQCRANGAELEMN